MRRTVGVLMLVMGGVAACGGEFRTQDYPTPQALFDASEDLYRRGKCGRAEVGFRQLTFQLPSRDTLAVRARFLLAECHFDQGAYLEAARQFRRVVDEAPTHSLAPFALLRAGDAQASLWKRPELDPTYGDAAMVTYRELLGRFPGTEAARRATLVVQKLGERFAEKDYKNGVFYVRFKAYDSAILYFRNVVARYPQSRFASLSLVQLVETYDKLGYTEERQETCDHLLRFYPDTQSVDRLCPATPVTP
jgi:outer membrane protein assembly factor BamD